MIKFGLNLISTTTKQERRVYDLVPTIRLKNKQNENKLIS